MGTKCRWRKIHNTAIAILLLCILFLIFQTYMEPSPNTIIVKEAYSQFTDIKLKKILYANKFFGEKHFAFGTGKIPFEGCKETNCLVWDKNDGDLPIPVEEFDAVLFHALDDPQGILATSIPERRLPYQRYIFYLLESPSTITFNFRPFASFFNWTMTYRRDSDIYAPYGWISDVSTPSKTPITWLEPNYTALPIIRKSSETKPIAWLVSKCKTPSKRHLYTNELAKHIPVDIFGSCGTHTCTRNDGCLKMLENNYMFYLSFENSLCVDYVTEKIFKVMNFNIVPIVYGGVNYKTVAPPMSYIDINDYASPKDLAKYLAFLIDNPTEYQKYFWWKSYYRVGSMNNHPMCSLCAMLNDESLPRKVYTDIDGWWNNATVCKTPNQYISNLEQKVEVGFCDWAKGTLHRSPFTLLERISIC